MADKNKPEESEPSEGGTSVFDLFEPPPERDPNSFGKIPVIKDDEIDLTDSSAEVKAAADAEAAGLQHWTAPPTGQVPAVLSSERSGTGMWGDIKGPSWHGEDPSWDGPDLADVFADTQSVSFDQDVIDLDEDDDDEGDYSDSFDSVAVQRPVRAASTTRPAETEPPVAPRQAPTNGSATPQVRHDAAGEQTAPRSNTSTRQQPAPQSARQRTPAPVAQKPAAQTPAAQIPPAQTPAPQTPAPQTPAAQVPPGMQSHLDDTATTPPVRSDAAAKPGIAPQHRNGGAAAARPVAPVRARTGEPNIDDIQFADDETGGIRRGPAPTGGMPGRVALQDEAAPRHARARNLRHEEDDDVYDDDGFDDEEIGLSPSSGRNIPQAIGVGLALAGVVLAAMYFGPYTTMLVIVVLALLAVLELYNAMRMAGLRPATLLGIVGTVAAPAAAYYRGDAAFPLIVALAVVFGTLWYLVGADTERPVLNLSLTMMGIFWVGGLAAFGALMVRQDLGIELLLATIIITVVSDTMAYIGGRAYGSRPFHHASPNKTWEGTITGFIGSVFAGFAIGITEFGTLWDGRLVPAIVLGAVVGCLAPMGDLAESVVKRDLGVKDMGTLLPGHGGVLDRLDGLLFALPGAFYLSLVYGLL